MSECYRCHKPLPAKLVGMPDWHWINPVPDAAANVGPSAMVPVCNNCDPPPMMIPRAQHEALMAAAKALAHVHPFEYVGDCKACAALEALRTAGIDLEDGT